MLYESEILLATKHNKESVIAPELVKHLNASIIVPDDFDTDKYGTFDGRVARKGSQFNTVLHKARDAASRFNQRYVIASEGSFGPHPTVSFLPGDVEYLLFYDSETDKYVCEVEVSTETNFAHMDLRKNDRIDKFLELTKFGTHAVTVRALEDDIILGKGIYQFDRLQMILDQYFKEYDVIRLETDMRAMMNPTRMRVIARVAEKLAVRLSRSCPECSHYGFGEVSVDGVLECELCSGETTLYKQRQVRCVFCGYSECHPREDGLRHADPTYCLSCNP